jgi:putative nucleotidyltransferase with HDIG domain
MEQRGLFMIKIPVSKLKSGMVISSMVKSKRGQVVAKPGTVINHQLIARMRFYGIESVEVENDILNQDSDIVAPDPAEIPSPAMANIKTEYQNAQVMRADIEKEAPLSENISEKDEKLSPDEISNPYFDIRKTYVASAVSYSQKLQKTPEFINFQIAYTKCLNDLGIVFSRIKGNHVMDGSQVLLSDCENICRGRTPLEIFDMVHAMRSLEDSIYSHSLNVALISRIIGRWLKYDKAMLDSLTLAAMLHDIGKTSVPPNILNKTGKLSPEEFNEIKKHTVYGEDILREAHADKVFTDAALNHHERSDGSGYPNGLYADDIDDFSAIIGIADVYDAMTAARPYRAPLCAFQVIEEFEKDGLSKYNPRFILTFLSHVASMYNNSKVMLSDGRAARIVYINSAALSRPVVEDNDKNVIDLSSAPDLHITSTL